MSGWDHKFTHVGSYLRMLPALRMHPDLLFVSLCGLIQLAVYSRLRHIYLSCAFTQAGCGFTLHRHIYACTLMYFLCPFFTVMRKGRFQGAREETAVLRKEEMLETTAASSVLEHVTGAAQFSACAC